jgi:hypothetical protein
LSVVFVSRLDKKEITLGKTRTLIATIELSNIHDVCYGSEVVINHDASLQYEKITIVTVSIFFDLAYLYPLH